LGTYSNPLLGWESNTQANAGFEMESSLSSFSSVMPVNAAFHKNLSSFFCCPTAFFMVTLLPDCCPILLPVARGNTKAK